MTKKKIVHLAGCDLTCFVRKTKRSKNLRLTIYPDQTIAASIPNWASFKLAEDFVTRKAPWILEKIQELKEKTPRLLFQGGEKDYLKLKEQTRNKVSARLEYFNQFYGFDFRKVFIRNQRSIWGSCSERGNLNFNYRMIHLPDDCFDYVVVHELCHLGQLNHSRNFWNLVAKTIPNYREIRRKLKMM